MLEVKNYAYQIVILRRKMGRPEVEKIFDPDVSFVTSAEGMLHAKNLSEEYAKTYNQDPPTKVAVNAYQIRTSLGTVLTWQVQPVSWKV